MYITVQTATAHDLENLMPVNISAKETLRKYYQRIDSVSQMDVAPTTLIVAEVAGELVGRCEFRVQNDELYFLSLGVLDSYRRRGVLKRIFEFLESEAKQNNCTKISCETIEETGNREIFQRLGMAVLNRKQSTKYLSPNGRAVHELFMIKMLS